MIKIFLLIIAVWLVITVLKRYIGNLESSSGSADEADKMNPGHPESEDMVQCAYCGVHLPASDSFLVGGQYYCCEAHSKALSKP